MGWLRLFRERNKQIDASKSAIAQPKKNKKFLGKIMAITTALGISVILYAHIYNLVQTDLRAKKDPMVKAYVTNMNYCKDILASVERDTASRDLGTVSNAIAKLDKANDNLGNAFYDNADISYLFKEGFLNKEQYDKAIEFRKLVQEIRAKLVERQLELI